MKLNKIPLLSISFRPFFILASIIAVLNPTLWASFYKGQLSMELRHVDLLFWHGYEMLFGFSSALIAGFIFTASSHWTGQRPYQGRALLILIFSWILARCSFFFSVEKIIFFILLNLFFLIFSFMLGLKLYNFKKQRNTFVPISLGLLISSSLFSFGKIYELEEIMNYGRNFGENLIIFLLFLISARVIPFFSSKKIKGLSFSPPLWVNIGCLVSLMLLMIPLPLEFEKFFLPIMLLLAFGFNFLRQIYWRPFKSISIPILFVLHIGVFLMNISFVLRFFSLFYEKFSFTNAPLHLAFAGGLGVVGVGIMSRVSLGHTGRIIKADILTIFSYVFILTGALLRSFIPIFSPNLFESSLHISSGIWTLGFFTFLISYSKKLCTKRVDGKAY